MSLPDIINGTFELLGGVMIGKHCLQLYRDKVIRGVSVLATAFFSAWGLWNLYYYPHLDQWMSFIGGCAIVTANCVWVGMMVYYGRGDKQ